MNATKNKISNYRFKLEQANYHFSNMKKNVNPLKREFAFELCAFVESARNVTLAMQKELAKVKGFDEWYTIKVKEMQGDELFRFFNETQKDKNYTTDTKKWNWLKIPQCWRTYNYAVCSGQRRINNR